jgi:predicted DNA-binding ribbon-helix-helix protein
VSLTELRWIKRSFHKILSNAANINVYWFPLLEGRTNRVLVSLAVRNRLHEGKPVKSAVIKRSVVVGRHKTSISLEDAFWRHLGEIARAQGWTISKLIAEIDNKRQYGNLSSAIRLFVLEHFRAKSNSTQPEGRRTSNLIEGNGGPNLRGPLGTG